jgi:murein DD-endopeptidase MepM/ murein hydrolase activator NlpD
MRKAFLKAPLKFSRISSGFSYARKHPVTRQVRPHTGIDYAAPKGTPVMTIGDGVVTSVKYEGAGGYVVRIKHNSVYSTAYLHLSKYGPGLKQGQRVRQGQIIGYVGSTGRSTGPHLHYETRYNGFAFDPQWLIDFKTGELRHRLFVLKKKYFNIYSNYDQDFEDEWKNEEDDKREEAERKAMKWHVIKSGDTLGRIAINNGTTVSAICRLNGITPKTVLKIGRRIRVR